MSVEFGSRVLVIGATMLVALSCGGEGTGGGPDRGAGGRVADADGAATVDSGSDDTSRPDAAVEEVGADSDAEAETGRADVAPADIGEGCEQLVYVANEAYRPADIIWVIDTSESMRGEIALIRENINDFASRIDGTGVDLRVIMVASKEDRTVMVPLPIPIPGIEEVPQEYLGVCVPPPLSGATGCPDTDNPPRFVHPDVNVYSTDALTRLMEAYDLFRRTLRPWARTHVVVVTDDSSAMSTGEFQTQVEALPDPGFTDDYIFHSIVALSADSCGDGVGDDYQALSMATGGVVQSVCLSNWDPIFEALLSGIVSGADLPCVYIIPDPDEGFIINPREVNVYHTPLGGEERLLYNVDGEEDCGESGGWYFDNPRDPDMILICPGVCGDGVEGTIDIAFGCETVKE